MRFISISDNFWSIAGLVSYSVGACRIIPAVPTKTMLSSETIINARIIFNQPVGPFRTVQGKDRDKTLELLRPVG